MIGESIGHYQILAELGRGGMGEVYRARDEKLNRDVALKILPDVFAANPDRLARFRREAQVLASLNHQNIAHIYGLEDGGAHHALVLELVEGPTLADLIASRARAAPAGLEIETAAKIARQIAEALEAAHEQGVVHRDLKPANVKVRPDGMVKVLDFGLARALDATPASSPEAMNSPTVTGGPMTNSGVILGTAPYMSPEQARGRVVDKRADIWAFGCVLFEMLTGRRPFDGESTADTVAAILGKEPEWEALPPATPPGLRALVERCLQKDAKDRLRDIGEARIEIDQLIRRSDSGVSAAGRTRSSFARRAVWIAAGVLLVAAAAWLIFWLSRPLGPPRYTQITDFSDTATAGSLSSDGKMLTFIRGDKYFQSRGQIYVKALPNGEAVPLTNDQRLKYAPVFTLDRSRIAFSMLDNGSWDTWTVPVTGGAPEKLLPNASGLTWIGPGRVLFSEIELGTALHMGILTATEARADSRKIYFPEHQRAMAHFSHASPDNRSILVVEMGAGGGWTEPCRLVPFDGSSTGRLVGPVGNCRSAAWSPDGNWMYFGVTIDGRSHLWRQAFPNGTPEQITFDPTDEEGVTVAPDGSLITSVGEARSSIWIHDDAGDRQITSEGSARMPTMSRDGRHVFYLQGSELLRVDLASGKSVNVLPGVSVSGFGYEVSPDETEVAFTQGGGIWLAPLNRRYSPREITKGGDLPSFGANGVLVFRERDQSANYLTRVNRDGSGRERVLSTPIGNKSGVSPDGEWVIVNRAALAAAATPDSGPTRPETVAVSVRGGEPRRICAFNCLPGSQWSPDGRLLYFGTPNQSGTVVIPIAPGKVFPDLPAPGFMSVADARAFPGARFIDTPSVLASPNASTYVFLKTDLRRNLFRIQWR